MHRIRITKRLDEFTVDVDLNLRHRVTGLFGPSGSGKTTLLDCVAGLLIPEAGTIAVNDFVLFDSARRIRLPTRKRRIGYVFQDGLLFEHLTVVQNLAYGRHGQGGPDWDQVIEILELGSLLRRKAAALSGGEKRRVAIGRALLGAPRLLLLDEPLVGLDRRLAGKTLAYIHSVLEQFDIPAIYVSHWVSDVVFLCNEVAVLEKGRLVAQGPPTSLIGVMESLDPLRPPALKNIFTADVAEVDAAIGLTTCDLNGQRLTIAGAIGQSATRVTAMVPARDVILARKRPELLSARNILCGTIQRIEHVGPHCVVFVNVGVEWMAEVTRSAADELSLKSGDEVYVIVKASTIHCVDWRC